MRLIFLITALAVLSIATAKNSTAKTKPKRQLDNIRTPQNLQYSLVLPHSRVTNFRQLTSSRRISNVAPRTGRLPPYAVQMEPVVQYSQKDPLYDRNHDNVDNPAVNKNEIYAQSKILNVDQDLESTYGPPYGGLPTAPLYSNEPSHHYLNYEEPEPIIEIIIRESNETLPAPPPPPIVKKKKEPVQVFYVKYSKDPHSKDKVIYEKPVPAITPPSNVEEDHHHEDYVTVTPEPLYLPTQTTTLRAIIKPESEIYHSDSKVKITFGNEGRNYGNRREEHSFSEDKEETAPRPAIALPNAPQTYTPLERSASPQQNTQSFHSGVNAHTQLQFQQPYISYDPQLPRQAPTTVPFRALPPQAPRQGLFNQHLGGHQSFANISPSPSNHVPTSVPTIPGPVNPNFQNFARPQNPPSFSPRPSPPAFGARQQFNGPPRSFHSGPQRPLFQQQQHQSHPPQYFDEPKYLQENYHTITTDHINTNPKPNQPIIQSRPAQSFNFGQKPSPSPSSFGQEHHGAAQQLIPFNQQLPQQRPYTNFNSNQNKPSFPVTPNRPPFYNLKPSPPLIENNRQPFLRQPPHAQPQQQFNFHQGPQALSRPSVEITNQGHQSASFNGFSPSPSPSPSVIPQTQFLPQPSSTPFFSFNPQPSAQPQQNYHQQSFASDRPQQSQSQTERPPSHQSIQDHQHLQNIGQYVTNGGELVPAISKYEQHITVNGPSTQPNYLQQSQPSASNLNTQYQQQAQIAQQQAQNAQQQAQNAQQQAQNAQQQQYDAEQEQLKQQLAQNVRKQQEEIQRLQTQLVYAQQQHEQQKQIDSQNKYNIYSQEQSQPSQRPQYVQERNRAPVNYVTSTETPKYYQTSQRTVEIRPTTQRYVSSTQNSVSSTPEPKKEEKKKTTYELPDEVPDDLRQQLLSSGILDNADISVLDYDKVGETPLESLPPDQLANFFSAGGAQQISASENQPTVVKPNGDKIESRIDDGVEEDDDQEIAASENVPSYVSPPSHKKQAVEMKVVHFDPKTAEGQKLASDYVKEDATHVDPVALNDKKYNRYLPLKVSGNQFPLPDILKGKTITSVVVLAPVETEALSNDHPRSERAASEGLRGIKFIAGDSLQNVLKKPTKDNFEKWLQTEKKTATDQQSVVLLVFGNAKSADEREIYMYDVSSGNVSKLSGDLSNAFVEAAENNSLSKDIEKLAIEGEGTPEDFKNDEQAAESEHVPLFVDLSGVSLEDGNTNQISITSGYSKTKHGRTLRRQ